MIDNSNLVKKVAFPREILPLSAVGVALVDFVLQSAVLLLFILASGYGFHWPEVALYPLSFVTLFVFTAAVTFWLSALNVRYRDVQHLLKSRCSSGSGSRRSSTRGSWCRTRLAAGPSSASVCGTSTS